MLYLLTFTNKNQPNVGRYASPMDGRYGYGICTLTRLKGFKSRFTKIQPHKCGGLGRDRVQADEWPLTKSETVMGPWRCKHASLIAHPDTQWFRMISKIRKTVSRITFKKMFKTHWMVQQKWATLWHVRFLPESSSYRMRKCGNKSITWPFFVTFLGWLSDPFNGESWPPNRGYKGHFGLWITWHCSMIFLQRRFSRGPTTEAVGEQVWETRRPHRCFFVVVESVNFVRIRIPYPLGKLT